MKMFVNILCDPPLGQSTTLAKETDKVDYTVLVESSTSIPAHPWEVSLWHNCNPDEEWATLDLVPDEEQECLAVQSPDRPASHSRYFKGSLAIDPAIVSSFRFTLKYRSDSQQEWHWINEDRALKDGEIILQKRIPSDPWDVFTLRRGAGFKLDRVTSDVPNTKIWYVRYNVPPAGKHSGVITVPLGQVVKQKRFFALTRLWTPWLIPQHGSDSFDISQDAIVASFLRSDGAHVTVLAVSSMDHCMTTLKASESGEVLMYSRNDSEQPSKGNVLFAVGFSQDTSLAACMYYARRLVSNFEINPMLKPDEEDVVMGDDMNPAWYQEWPDGLNYCTWNSLGQQLTETKVLDAVKDLKASGIGVSNIILDDNWQSVDGDELKQWDRGWTRFEANARGFPDGLAKTVARIREIMPNLNTVCVWHSILGYWGGISPGSELAQKYTTKQVRRARMEMPGVTHPETEITVVDEPDVERFYNDFYTFLESCNVNGVKTDAQFLLEQLKLPDDRRRLINAYQDAWSVAGLRHFARNQTSCMAQAPHLIFHSQLLQNKPRLMLRNSDDFYPNEPESHAWHIFTNAMTATFTQYLNVTADWDMFQTAHPWAGFHAAARCLSGGPICITDVPGSHDLGLISEITAKTIQDATVVLRPSRPAKVIGSQVYSGYSERLPLKVGTYSGGGKGVGSGIVGMFNIGSHPASDFVRLTDFPGVEPEQEYVVRAHRSGQVSPARSGSAKGPITNVFLPHRGWEILTAYPLRQVDGISSKVAALGLVGKMTGAAATLRFDVDSLPDGRLKMTVFLKALGVLGLYVSDLASKSVRQNFMITLQGEAIPVESVGKDQASDRVLLVDVERAWRELDMDVGWSNEVAVTVFMSG